MNSHKSTRFIADSWNDYELIDSGDGSKLEKFGKYILIGRSRERFGLRPYHMTNGIMQTPALSLQARSRATGRIRSREREVAIAIQFASTGSFEACFSARNN